MKKRPLCFLICFSLFAAIEFGIVQITYADLIIDLVWEFDGNSDGTVSFGTVELTQNGSSVDFEIIANTTNLMGGDIHELYFNLPNTVDASSLAVSNSGGVSNQTINPFTAFGTDPSIRGGAGSMFDTGVNFGNGAGPPGNGLLTTAAFSLTATGGLMVSDLVFEKSPSNNAPPVFMAVHFQSTAVFGASSETVGGVPEPGCVGLLAVFGLALLRRRSRRI